MFLYDTASEVLVHVVYNLAVTVLLLTAHVHNSTAVIRIEIGNDAKHLLFAILTESSPLTITVSVEISAAHLFIQVFYESHVSDSFFVPYILVTA